MKTTAYYEPRFLARRPLNLPNGMTRREFFCKVLDVLLVSACGAGIAAMMLLTLMLF